MESFLRAGQSVVFDLPRTDLDCVAFDTIGQNSTDSNLSLSVSMTRLNSTATELPHSTEDTGLTSTHPLSHLPKTH